MVIDRKSVSASVTCPPLSVYGSDVMDFPFRNLVSKGQMRDIHKFISHYITRLELVKKIRHVKNEIKSKLTSEQK